ncbi:MAG TPA: hypothetical protein VJ576_09940 [Rhodocyclaceae bacterium]|nr:hypothetical protein [Rhodocyclaceae bacterium]
MKTWLIGSGGMAQDYAKVLRELDVELTTIGRGEDSAARFEAAMGFAVQRGGLEGYLQNNPELPDNAIVSVGVEALAPTVAILLDAGIRRILVEKPAGLYPKDILGVEEHARSVGADVFVAYNRRFYSAVREAKKMIAADGGVQSFNFEFTEWGHEIETLTKAPGVKEQWVLGNSSHVIDLAFYLGGVPEELCAFQAGSLSWHPNAAVFSGAGRTAAGALFSYQANWGAPGRWGVEICTSNYRLIFRPMEALQLMKKGSVAIETVNIEGADLDKRFKPGLFLQTESFLLGQDASGLCGISEHAQMLPIYTSIAGYK